MTEPILVERADGEDEGIVTVVLNRPEKLNAMTRAMWSRLGEAMTELSADETVRCLIVRGAGERAFSPGNDISAFETDRSNAEQAEAYGALMHRTIDAFKACRHPIVAMIHGICVGGGLEIAGLCDIRICGESSRFGVPVSKLGLVMAYPEIGALAGLVGRHTALEILLEGRVFDAEVEEEARATARRIAAGAPLVHRWHKKFLDRLDDPAPLSQAELKEGFACYDTEDFRIGYKAFLEKKNPHFTGR